MRASRTVLGVMTALTAMTVGGAVAPSALASAAVPAFSNGGCGGVGSGGGATFKACVSGAGSSVNWDGYVSSSSSSCSVHLVLFQNGTGVDQTSDVNCTGTNRHFTAPAWPVTSGATYQTSIFVTVNGSTYTKSSLVGTG